MASPASSRVRPISVRSRRSWAPTSIRWTVGPPGAVLLSVIGASGEGVATQSAIPPELSRTVIPEK
jgi:hypothetical protein